MMAKPIRALDLHYPMIQFLIKFVIILLTPCICLLLVGRQWIKQMALSAVLFPLLVCGTAFMINFIAIYYHASRAIPFVTMVSGKFI